MQSDISLRSRVSFKIRRRYISLRVFFFFFSFFPVAVHLHTQDNKTALGGQQGLATGLERLATGDGQRALVLA